ncbi:MAG: hypothetical protein ACTSQ4_00970 [Candidatus Heimdallarchaeaceae archaeon]
MNKSKLIAIIVISIIVLSGIGVGVYFIIKASEDSEYNEDEFIARAPAIYLYNINDETFTDSLSVYMPNGFATITIPQIPLGVTIIWNDLEIHPDSKIIYQNTVYPYLYYEAEISSKLELSVRGLCIEKDQSDYIFNSHHFKLFDFRRVLSNNLLSLGLYELEVADFIEYWFETDPLFTEDGYHYLIQLENNWIENNFQINTNLEYSTNRIFFAYIYSDISLYSNKLQSPHENVVTSNSDYILHEWGIII